MTINEENPPQDKVHSDPTNGLEALVHALAERATAADQRSAELAERVALLEGPAPKARGGLGTARASFSRAKSFLRPASDVDPPSDGVYEDAEAGALPAAEAGDGHMRTVVGVPENDPGKALADRVLLVERRLEEYVEVKAALDERKYELPESTFTFLITHGPLSMPFAFAVFTIALSIGCLSLTLASSVKEGTEGNRLGVPAGVDCWVQVAQFLGAIVGVLMEDEVPQGLQLIANGAGHTLLLNGQKAVQKRVVVSSAFRLVVGYLFLSSLLINLAQNNDVISILYDVLALEFVENIDDTAFSLAKKGFFGRSMLVAANQKNNLEIYSPGRRSLTMRQSATGASTRSMTERRLSFSGLIASNNRVNRLVRLVYFLNAAIVLTGLGYITASQKGGRYRCNTIRVAFDEEVWENANVTLSDGGTEERLLIYPTFNGVYKEQESHEGYPRYVEQNKNDGSEFGPSVTGAEIIFCHDIGSWVFMHPEISVNNECSWLWRSSETVDYNILSTTFGSWEAWTGEVKLSQVSITCNECSESSDCNYHGTCEDEQCRCDPMHFGDSCEFDMPCGSLASEKAHRLDPVNGVKWEQKNPITLWGNDPTDPSKFHKVYNRPVYIQEGLSGEPYDMRLYKIMQKEESSSPSSQPSTAPSILNGPTAFPSQSPSSNPTPLPSGSLWGTDQDAIPTPAPMTPESEGKDPVAKPDHGYDPDFGYYGDEDNVVLPTPPPTRPLHSQNEYDTAPDFADWDDFFESPHLHDLESILEDYSVIISYSGSRFYGTIVEPDATPGELFPPDYHAFWSRSFDVNRTFIISDTTFGGSPVGIDFFEMRRRVESVLRNRNVHFAYGPYGALIPLMEYQHTGFFHCLDETTHPSSSPSSSAAPSPSPSISVVPTTTPAPSNLPRPVPHSLFSPYY